MVKRFRTVVRSGSTLFDEGTTLREELVRDVLCSSVLGLRLYFVCKRLSSVLFAIKRGSALAVPRRFVTSQAPPRSVELVRPHFTRKTFLLVCFAREYAAPELLTDSDQFLSDWLPERLSTITTIQAPVARGVKLKC